MGSSVRKVLEDAVSPPLTWRESAATPRVAPWSRWTTRATRSCRILWMDMRAAEQTEQVLATGDVALRVNSDGAGPVSAEWMVPKALWLKQNRPELFARAAKVCEYQDYVNLKLTGRYCASANNVAVRWHFVDGKPPTSLLAKLGMPELAEKWPKDVVQMGHAVAPLSEAAAAHLGLDAGIPVAQGGADALRRDGRPRDRSTRSTRAHHRPSPPPRGDRGRVPRPGDMGTYSGALVGERSHVVEGGQTSTGSVVNWFKTMCGGGEGFYDEVNAAAALIPPGCEGLVMQEHLQGNRTRTWTRCRAAWSPVSRCDTGGARVPLHPGGDPAARGSSSTRCARTDTSRVRRRRRGRDPIGLVAADPRGRRGDPLQANQMRRRPRARLWPSSPPSPRERTAATCSPRSTRWCTRRAWSCLDPTCTRCTRSRTPRTRGRTPRRSSSSEGRASPRKASIPRRGQTVSGTPPGPSRHRVPVVAVRGPG